MPVAIPMVIPAVMLLVCWCLWNGERLE
jgi:hypothetical protein